MSDPLGDREEAARLRREWGGYANGVSHHVLVIIENDQFLHNAVVDEARRLLDWLPSMTPQTLGVNLKTSVRRWAEDREPLPGVAPQMWEHLHRAVEEHGAWTDLSETDLADFALGVINEDQS